MWKPRRLVMWCVCVSFHAFSTWPWHYTPPRHARHCQLFLLFKNVGFLLIFLQTHLCVLKISLALLIFQIVAKINIKTSKQGAWERSKKYRISIKNPYFLLFIHYFVVFYCIALYYIFLKILFKERYRLFKLNIKSSLFYYFYLIFTTLNCSDKIYKSIQK